MRIFAIDPGNKVSTAVLFDQGAVRDCWKDANNETMREAIKTHACHCDVVLVEDIESFGMEVGVSVFRTAQWAGRFEELTLSLGAEMQYVKRSDVKLTLCRNRTAKDKNIRAALIEMFGGDKETAVGKKASPGPLYSISNHAWSALALAVTWEEMEKDRKLADEDRRKIEEACKGTPFGG